MTIDHYGLMINDWQLNGGAYDDFKINSKLLKLLKKIIKFMIQLKSANYELDKSHWK